MKYLYLIRHAKSSWSFDLPDHDRPLGKRGRKDVFKMGTHLAQKHLAPDIMISSTASRAFYTALHLCDAWGLDENEIGLSKTLFHAGPLDIVNAIHQANSGERMALFAHNPGITDCVNLLSGSDIENVPTCGVCVISFQTDTWKGVRQGEGKLEDYCYPKGL